MQYCQLQTSHRVSSTFFGDIGIPLLRAVLPATDVTQSLIKDILNERYNRRGNCRKGKDVIIIIMAVTSFVAQVKVITEKCMITSLV